MQHLIKLIKTETVLSIAVILAAVSAVFVHPDSQYIRYVDFRTLALLFCLMTVIAGIRRRGVFSVLAARLVSRSENTAGMVTALVLASFFLSMLITNDVSLITLVPLTMNCFERLPAEDRKNWLIPGVVLETVAANLGSMTTPVGNPQNLYLYGLSDLTLFSFLKIILPYSMISLILLLLWIKVHQIGANQIRASQIRAQQIRDHQIRAHQYSDKPQELLHPGFRKPSPEKINKINGTDNENQASDAPATGADSSTPVIHTNGLAAYFALFALCLATVARLVPWPVPFAAVLIYVLLSDRKTIFEADYSLLGTFLALFIFIGNLGRIPSFRSALSGVLTGHEVLTAIAASQVMSNVPAAILLSGFTSKTDLLIIGTNLGGLGTLIASMASLISYKLITADSNVSRSQYLIYFTVTNAAFLFCLAAFHVLVGYFFVR